MQDSRFNEGPHLENAMPANDTRSTYPSSGGNNHVVYVERKPNRKCYCCFPLVPGVYFIMILKLITFLAFCVCGGLGFNSEKDTAFFTIFLGYGLVGVLFLLIGLIGLNKWNPKIYVVAPIFMVISAILSGGLVLWAYLLTRSNTEPIPGLKSPQSPGIFEPESAHFSVIAKNETDSATLGIVYALVADSLLGLFFSYTMIRMYIVMKKEPKN